MKKIILILLLTVLLIAILFAADERGQKEDMMAIKQAVLDYIEGWYEGNAERMEKALHPDLLVKTGIVVRSDKGEVEIHRLDAQKMVAMTQKGGGKDYPKEKQKNDVMILDVCQNTATAKSVSPHYIDYIHLGKFDGEWKIVNVLWELNKDSE